MSSELRIHLAQRDQELEHVFSGRADVVVHLEALHGWNPGGLDDPIWRTTDGHFLVGTDELLAIHYELHRLRLLANVGSAERPSDSGPPPRGAHEGS